MSGATTPGRPWLLESKVTILGCVYLASVLCYYALKFLATPVGVPPGLLLVVPFASVFILAALGVWRKPKAGFVTAVGISALMLILLGPNLGLGEPLTVEGLATGGATAVAVFFITLFFALFGARRAWTKSRPAERRGFQMGRSAAIGALIFLLLFIISGVAYGATQTKGVTNTGQASVVIAPGAAYITSHEFYLPPTLTVKVGQTVTWKNLDSAPHTVTSDTGVFMSGNLDSNGGYSFTFTRSGTYHYSCDYHTWMTGEIVVTSG